MPNLRTNPDGPPALELTWQEAQDLCSRLKFAIEDAVVENDHKLPTDQGLCLMWCEWPISININC